MSEMRYLPVSVYRSGTDCTNGGVSAETDTIYVKCPRGNYSREDVPVHLRFVAEQRGPEYWAVKPEVPHQHGERLEGSMIGPMAGGNIAYTTDSRLRPTFHIHDRFETQEQYDLLSR